MWRSPLPVRAAGVTAVAAGADFSCELTTTGGVKCWGDSGELGDGGICNPLCATPVDVVGLTTGVAAITAGDFHACALTTGGGVKCWGWDFHGQLGDGRTCGTYCHTPVDVVGLTSNVTAIAAGSAYTCALTSTGGVKCWGANDFGELGQGSSTGPDACGRDSVCSTTPVDVPGLTSGVTAIAAGPPSCALTTAGGVKCWGGNTAGELGSGTTHGPETCYLGASCSTSPVDVQGLRSGVTAISASLYNGCALTTEGAVWCWGSNIGGQLGHGTSTGPETCFLGPCSSSPVEVTGLATGVANVVVGNSTACAIGSARMLKCWGSNAFGKLGDGITTGPQQCGTFRFGCSTTPVEITALGNDVAAASVGWFHTCALTMTGSVKCWGQNDYGQLGDGTTTSRSVPADVVATPPYPVGDVNCDGTIDAIDAALILQFDARLISQLRCQQNADVNHDHNINSVDALLVLDFIAGYLVQLPP